MRPLLGFITLPALEEPAARDPLGGPADRVTICAVMRSRRADFAGQMVSDHPRAVGFSRSEGMKRPSSELVDTIFLFHYLKLKAHFR